MNAVELSNNFDILYNNVMSDSAPGLSEYEKSIFLTQAQLAFVKAMYNKAFEHDEAHRRALDTLVVDYDVTPVRETEDFKPRYLRGDRAVHAIFRLPRDLMFIVHETAQVTGDDCTDGQYIDVVPENYDEMLRDVKNPFRGPSRWRVLRIDDGLAVRAADGDGQDRYVELVSKDEIERYAIRYVRRPMPIILEELEGGLTIDGLTHQSRYGHDGEQACELNESVHEEILAMAVQLAMATYKRQ